MGKASNLFLRVVSAVILLPLVIGLVLWREPLGFAVLSLVATAIALKEFANMSLRGRSAAEKAFMVGAGIGLAVALYAWPGLGLPAVIATTLVIMASQVFFADDIHGAGQRAGASLAGVIYLAPTMVALPILQRDIENGALWVLLAMGATFSCDTGAYFVGRAFGRRKLAPKISPGKTWEGVMGGVLGALVFCITARMTFFPVLEIRDIVFVGIGASILGPIGDLVESLLKRSAGVKDSGQLIPGHGGMLDRVDALLFVGAFVFLYAGHLR